MEARFLGKEKDEEAVQGDLLQGQEEGSGRGGESGILPMIVASEKETYQMM